MGVGGKPVLGDVQGARVLPFPGALSVEVRVWIAVFALKQSRGPTVNFSL